MVLLTSLFHLRNQSLSIALSRALSLFLSLFLALSFSLSFSFSFSLSLPLFVYLSLHLSPLTFSLSLSLPFFTQCDCVFFSWFTAHMSYSRKAITRDYPGIVVIIPELRYDVLLGLKPQVCPCCKQLPHSYFHIWCELVSLPWLELLQKVAVESMFGLVFARKSVD